jgi:hypothetical protein
MALDAPIVEDRCDIPGKGDLSSGRSTGGDSDHEQGAQADGEDAQLEQAISHK